jgi:hypothetical protein
MVVVMGADIEVESIEALPLELVVGTTEPMGDFKVDKPHQLVYQDAFYFNAPQHQVKTARQTEDTHSLCSESDANTVLDEEQDLAYWVKASEATKKWLKMGKVKTSKLKMDKVKMGKLKMPVVRIDLRNVHVLMVVGGLYPPLRTHHHPP